MPGIRSHSTGTSDRPWSAATNERNARSDESAGYYSRIYAWRDPDGEVGAKSTYKFPHHFVGSDGEPGVASTRACSAAIAVLNGGRGGSNIPDSDRKAVYNHVARHLRDAGKGVPELKDLDISYKTLEFKIESLDEDGTFTGYASVFKNVDLGGDVIEPGAFTKTLNDRGHKVPLFRSHKYGIGVTNVEQDDEGLRVTKGIINLDKEEGRDAYSDLKFYRDHGMPMGMSIGYKAVPSQTRRVNGKRHLGEIMLFEVTLDELPLNEEARVEDVKSTKTDFRTEFENLRKLRALHDAQMALEDAIWSTIWDPDMDRDEKQAAVSNSIGDFHDTVMEMLPEWFDLVGIKAQFEAECKDGGLSENLLKQLRSWKEFFTEALSLVADDTEERKQPEAVITPKAAPSEPEDKKNAFHSEDINRFCEALIEAARN